MTPRAICPWLLSALAAAALFTAVTPAPTLAQDGTWSQLSAAPSPSVRREYAGVYDRVNERYLIFGGFNGDYVNTYFLFNEVWALSLTGDTPTWTQLSVEGTLPGARHSPQWGYDPARNRVLIFGGYGSHLPGEPYAYLDDVWELSLDGTPTWSEIVPSGIAPTGRLAGAAVYDPLRQRFVGFGGTLGAPVDTWVLNLQGQANWQHVPTQEDGPNGGYGMTCVYDASEDRMITFGGSNGPEYWGVNDNVWQLSLHGTPTWSQMLPDSGPVARRSGTAVFDALRNRMVIYGGWDNLSNQSSSFLGDVWALSLGETPAWTQLGPGGSAPSGRNAMSAIYDPINDQMVVFGGWNGLAILGDTQMLSWGGASVDAALTADATITPDGDVRVEWDVDNATGVYGGVYRRAPGGLWTSIATAQVGPTGQLTYEDTSVQNGSTYEYMMVVGSQRGETFGGETQVQVVPTGVTPQTSGTFALERVAPNPVVDRLTVSFALPNAGRATIELMDVAGRRWMEREVGAFGAGTHSIEMRTGGTVPAGLYFVRLTQGGRTAASRIAVTGAH